jgi:hypothetical protein
VAEPPQAAMRRGFGNKFPQPLQSLARLALAMDPGAEFCNAKLRKRLPQRSKWFGSFASQNLMIESMFF